MASVDLQNTLLLTGHQAFSLYSLEAFFIVKSHKFTPAEEGAGVELLTGHQAPLLTVRRFLKFIPYLTDYAQLMNLCASTLGLNWVREEVLQASWRVVCI